MPSIGVVAEMAAGLKLKADYQAAHLENRIIASYNAARGMNAGGFQNYERTEAEEAAYRRWRRALLAVVSADSSGGAGCLLPRPFAVGALHRCSATRLATVAALVRVVTR
jgi:hypothetical protein